MFNLYETVLSLWQDKNWKIIPYSGMFYWLDIGHICWYSFNFVTFEVHFMQGCTRITWTVQGSWSTFIYHLANSLLKVLMCAQWHQFLRLSLTTATIWNSLLGIQINNMLICISFYICSFIFLFNFISRTTFTFFV